MQELEPRPLKPTRILVVEDDPVVARDLQHQIQDLGCECVGHAVAGEPAICLAGELRPDLVLMDVQLVGAMDGITAAQAIREQFALPVVFLTAFTGDTTIARAKLTDPFGYLIKPFRERDLRVGIELALYKHQTERKLQASEEHHRTILQAAMDGFCVVDWQGQVLEVNATYCRMSGYSATELLALRLSDLEATETAAAIATHIQKIMAQGEDRFESRHRRKDGSIFDVEVSIQYRPTAGGQFVAFLRDLTARKQAEAEQEKLVAQNRQLQKAESLGRMAGAIAHHFNNQLAAVMGNLELVQNDVPQNSEAGECLAAALKSAHKAAAMSGLMLTYLGQTHSRPEPLDLAEVCRRALPLLQVGLPQAVVLTTDLPAPGPVISGNADQIHQVLSNLFTNAWEASGAGPGAIHLTVTTVAAAAIPASNRYPLDWQPQGTTYACLEVADQGGGIKPADLELLFDPFFSSKFPGRGLGLPVVLGILRKHAGVVTVASEPGRGSTFRVFLPVVAAAISPKPDLIVPVRLPTKGGGTVLVVEDEPALLKVTTRMLENFGFTVFSAADGGAAVELFQQHQAEIGCVLCDLTMPQMDGWATIAVLRQLAPGLPVILTSGYDAARALAGDHAERPQAFLGKPYTAAALINAIRQVLPAAAPSQG